MIYVRLLLLVVCLLFSGDFFCQAQQITVVKFTSVPIGKEDKVKGKRVIDLYMKEEGYTFSSPAGDLEVKKGDGFARLVVSKEVRYIKISHPKFGTVNWKIPVSRLKSRKLYKAEIVSPVLPEYKQQHQWLKIMCPYNDAIIVIDSTYKKAEQGEMQFLLPVGEHIIKTVAAFFQDKTDTVFLDAENPVGYTVRLVPNYSYLRVDYGTDSMKVYIDNQKESRESLRRKKLVAGTHYLYAKYKDREYAREIVVKPSEFQTVSLDITEFYSGRKLVQPVGMKTENGLNREEPLRDPVLDSIPVTIKAFDERCRIYINNEYVKDGFWSGYLYQGDYLISNKRDGLTSKPVFVRIQDQDRLNLSLNSPASSYGDLNIESNVVNADIILNGHYIGKTPYIAKYLDTDKEHTVVLRKEGYKRLEKKVKVTPNGETRIVLTLHKK